MIKRILFFPISIPIALLFAFFDTVDRYRKYDQFMGIILGERKEDETKKLSWIEQYKMICAFRDTKHWNHFLYDDGNDTVRVGFYVYNDEDEIIHSVSKTYDRDSTYIWNALRDKQYLKLLRDKYESN